MADIIDDAQEAIEAAEALRNAARKPFEPIRTGFCIECDEPTEFTFCSKDCRDDHEKRERMKSINGKPE
jgi:hypothetical protein